MTKIVLSGVESSSAWSPGIIAPPAIVGKGLMAPYEPSSFDEVWEPPTAAEWRRAVGIVALQVVRELAGGRVALRLPRPHGSNVTWH